MPIKLPRRDGRERGSDGAETVADGRNVCPPVCIRQGNNSRGEHDGHQRAGQSLRNALRADDDQHRRERHGEGIPTHGGEMSEIAHPFVDKAGGHCALNVQAEKIFDLRGEDGERDPGRKTDNNGIGNKLNHTPQTKHTEQHKEETGHDRGNQQSGKTETLDHAVDDDDESPRGATDLHATSAQCRDDDPGHNSRQDTHTGADCVLHVTARRGGDGKSDGQREGDDAHHQTGEQIGGKIGTTITAKIPQQARAKTKRLHKKEVFTYDSTYVLKIRMQIYSFLTTSPNHIPRLGHSFGVRCAF